MSSLDDEFRAAHAAHRLGRLADAERGYVAILARAPDHAAACQFLGVLRMQTGRHAEAVELLRQAAALAPRNALGLLNLGVALASTGDPAGADEAFARAAALEPRLAAAHAGRGGVALARRLPHDAVAHYRRAIALDPNSARYLADCANALLGLRQPAEALAACASALRIDPALADAHHYAGCALLDLDRPADAVAPLTRATELGRTASSYNLGVALRLTRKYEDAAHWFEKSLAAQPAGHFALGALVDTLGHACAWEKAAPFERRLVEAVEQGALVGDPGHLLATIDSPRLHLAYARSLLKARIGAAAPAPRVESGDE